MLQIQLDGTNDKENWTSKNTIAIEIGFVSLLLLLKKFHHLRQYNPFKIIELTFVSI